MRALAPLAALSLLLPSVALAQGTPQGQKCIFEIVSVGRSGSASEAGGQTNYFAGGGVHLRCRGTSVSMRSDSLASYGGRIVQFVGSVKYQDSALTMEADRGTYFRDGDRWEARGRVRTRNAVTGSTLAGPSLDYFRQVPGTRDTAEMYAVSRPRIEYASKDSAGKVGEPYIIVGDRIRFRGEDRLWAGGKVTVNRSDFAARGDSLRLDTGAGSDGTLLGGTPELRGFDTDTFTLTGRRIDFKLEGRDLSYLTAKRNAHAVNGDWDLVADTIGIDVERRKLRQTVAWGDSLRPRAKSPRYEVRADSLALETPDGRISELRAFGGGWLGGAVDSASGERDWLAGDTVTARFATRDSASVLHELEARKDARSFSQSADARRPGVPSLSYIRADFIHITMKTSGTEGVERLDVRGQVDGVRMEAQAGAVPRSRARGAAPDDSTPRSAAPRPGSLSGAPTKPAPSKPAPAKPKKGT
jgi:hypothetical protein